jgi:hypothetical protein
VPTARPPCRCVPGREMRRGSPGRPLEAGARRRSQAAAASRTPGDGVGISASQDVRQFHRARCLRLFARGVRLRRMRRSFTAQACDGRPRAVLKSIPPTSGRIGCAYSADRVRMTAPAPLRLLRQNVPGPRVGKGVAVPHPDLVHKQASQV